MHTEHLFRKYKLPKFEDIKLINDISIAHSIVHGYASQITQQDIKKVQPHERNCRNLFNLEIDNFKKNQSPSTSSQKTGTVYINHLKKSAKSKN